MIEERRDFADREELAAALASDVAACLSGAITDGGEALLAVSGGTTPALFFDRLSEADIDWPRITVTLVDERCVPEANERSNARLVREHLLKGEAAAARFVPLFGNEAEAEKLGPFDAVILGMGTDGHTASFFPKSDGLAEALAKSPSRRIVTITTPGAAEKRLTFTLPALLDTAFLALHMEGEEKLKVLEQALARGPIEAMPVRAILTAEEPVVVYWCP